MFQLTASQYSPVGDIPLNSLMQPRPVQKLDVLCFHLKILCEQSFNFRYIQNLIEPLIQLDDTAVFISHVLFARSKQKPCVILGTHDPRLRIKGR